VIGANNSTTVVFPVPIDLIKVFTDKAMGKPINAE
jgi:hypothetical protein